MSQRVVCAACRYGETVVCGARHWDKWMQAQSERLRPEFLPRGPGEWEQGFIDQFGNFLTREEAKAIAEREGQIVRRCGGDERELFSENLY